MDKAIEIILSQGLSGAMMVIVFLALSKRDKQLLESLHDRLKEKDKVIDRLLESEIRTSQIISAFSEMKPVFDEIKELLKRIYTSKL